MNENVREFIYPSKEWLDTDGKRIQAHGGRILYENGIYYWYGENKDMPNRIIPFMPKYNPGKKAYRHRTDAAGVSCYSSKDLVNWRNEGIVLTSEQDDYEHDLYFENVLERPKVVHNKKTGQYVMWMHVDTSDYQYARAGVAVSNSPVGPFKYINSVRPNDSMSRDMTLFKDEDEKCYLIFSSEENKTMHVCLLTDDYLQPTNTFTRNFIDRKREAPAIFKHEDIYYIVTSGCTGWEPNEAEYAVARSPLGPWEVVGNPCMGEQAETTFASQSTHVLKVEGKEDLYIFMGDRWFETNLSDSRYVWLPIRFVEGKMNIEWMEKWSLEILK